MRLNILKHYSSTLLILLLSVLFFLAVAGYIFCLQTNTSVKWFSPDETANYIITKLYSQKSEMQIYEKYNLYADGIIRPRSFRVDNGWLKPVSFPGIILIFGFLAKQTSVSLLPFMTPIFAAVGLIFYYLLIKKIFGGANATVATILLASFPVYFYYSARSMFHNILFVVLVVIFLYFFILSFSHKKENDFKSWKIPLFSALAGTFLGLSIMTRTSEIVWLIPVCSILLISFWKNWTLKNLPIFLLFSAISLIPLLHWNTVLYGSPWLSGYSEINQAISDIAVSSSNLSIHNGERLNQLKSTFNLVIKNIFYFGFHPYQSFKMVYYYVFKMFYWYLIPAIIGFILLLLNFKKLSKKHFLYLIILSVLSLILVIYYGSWEFHDNPDPKQTTIGNSYTRYWLPIYLGLLPFAAMFINKITNLKDKKLGIFFKFSIIGFVFFMSFCFTWWGSEEGLAYSFAKSKSAEQELNSILALTENNSIIITRYHDKLFFPERKVIIGLFDDSNMIIRYAELAKHLPVYYYNFTFPEKDLLYLETKLPKFGLSIELIQRINRDFSLYRLFKI